MNFRNVVPFNTILNAPVNSRMSNNCVLWAQARSELRWWRQSQRRRLCSRNWTSLATSCPRWFFDWCTSIVRHSCSRIEPASLIMHFLARAHLYNVHHTLSSLFMSLLMKQTKYVGLHDPAAWFIIILCYAYSYSKCLAWSHHSSINMHVNTFFDQKLLCSCSGSTGSKREHT